MRSNYGGPVDTFLHVLREEGWMSLYVGLTPALIGNAYAQGACHLGGPAPPIHRLSCFPHAGHVCTGVYYYWYAFFRSVAEGKGTTKKPVGTLTSMLVGGTALLLSS